MKGYARYRVTGCGPGAAAIWRAVLEHLDTARRDGSVRLGEMLQVYERSAYVEFDDAVATRIDVSGPALVLLAGPGLSGPLATRIESSEMHGFPADALAPGEECRGNLRDEAVLVSIGGSLELELPPSVLDDSTPTARGALASTTEIHRRCDDVVARLVKAGVEDGLGWLPDVAARAEGIDTEPAKLIDAWRAVLEGDSAPQPPPGVGLLGRGPGATPSGDDVLSGVVLALDRATAGDRRDRVRATGASLVDAATTRTTKISTALLAQAVLGRTSTPVDAMLDALLNRAASEDDHRAAVDGMVALGHTSGVDMLLGIVLALGFVLEE